MAPTSDKTVIERSRPVQRVEAFIRRWDAADRWRRFFYPEFVCITNLFRLGKDDALVVHESLECIFNTPPWLPADSAFFLKRRGTQTGEYWNDCNILITDPMAQDVMGGRTMKELSGALEKACSLPGCRSVVVHFGCLTEVLGDNPVPAMKRLEKSSDARFYWISNTIDYEGYTARLIGDRLEKVAPADRPRDPLGAAVVGGSSPAENAELLGLLSRIGLKPLGVVLPDVSFDCFERVADASTFVWAKQTALIDIAQVAFTGLPVKLLRPAAPVGIRGTLDWLRQAGRACDGGARSAPAAAKLEKTGTWKEELARLRRKARRWTAAFVAGPDDVEAVLDTAPVYGFSVLNALLEMGFKVRFLVYGKPADYSIIRDGLLGGEAADPRVDLEYFRDPAGLDRLLRAEELGMVFSHFTADPRVVSAGKAVFSEMDFEMGLDGFLRTARRLVRACGRRPLAGLQRYLGGRP